MTDKRYEDESTDYRRGFVEGLSGERDAYLLCTGCTNLDEYERGLADGLTEREETQMSYEPATEDWIRKRWGGFTYLDIARNEDFSLYFLDGTLTLEHEFEIVVSTLLLFENATQQNVIDAERIFGIGIK